MGRPLNSQKHGLWAFAGFATGLLAWLFLVQG